LKAKSEEDPEEYPRRQRRRQDVLQNYLSLSIHGGPFVLVVSLMQGYFPRRGRLVFSALSCVRVNQLAMGGSQVDILHRNWKPVKAARLEHLNFTQEAAAVLDDDAIAGGKR
jgi:hypothetical protein